MKKTLAILLAMILCVLAAGSAMAEDIVIGATGLQEDQFTQVLISGYEDAGEELGIKVITSNSQISLERETESVMSMLQAGATGIIIECVNPDATAAIAETAKDAGAAVFASAITLNSDAIFASALNDCYDLGTDIGSYARGYFEANFTKEEEIKLAIVAFDAQDAAGSAGRVNGFLDQLSDFNINVVARQDYGSLDNAYAVVTDMLTATPDIDVFYFACEVAAVAGVNAIEAAGSPAKGFAVDCSEVLVEMMKAEDPILLGCTAQDPYTIGKYSVYTTYEYLKNGTLPENITYNVPCIRLTTDNLDEVDAWLAAWNEHAN